MRQTEKGNHVVLLTFHEHWIVLVAPVLTYLLSLGVFAFLWFSAAVLYDVSILISSILYLFSITFLIIVFQRFFLKMISWELSNWAVTKQFVIDFQNNLITTNDVTYINIGQIDEIEKRKHGFFSNLFRFGDVHINLAAAPYPIVCHYIPFPGDFTNLLKAIRDNRLDDELDLSTYQEIYGRKFRYCLKKVL